MVLYNATKVKATLAESGITNNAKIGFYGEMADNFVLDDLMRISNMPDPPVVTTGVLTTTQLNRIKDHATNLAIAYFYKYESGDTMTSEDAEKNWKQYFAKYFHPRFTVTTGTR